MQSYTFASDDSLLARMGFNMRPVTAPEANYYVKGAIFQAFAKQKDLEGMHPPAFGVEIRPLPLSLYASGASGKILIGSQLPIQDSWTHCPQPFLRAAELGVWSSSAHRTSALSQICKSGSKMLPLRD